MHGRVLYCAVYMDISTTTILLLLSVIGMRGWKETFFTNECSYSTLNVEGPMEG